MAVKRPQLEALLAGHLEAELGDVGDRGLLADRPQGLAVGVTPVRALPQRLPRTTRRQPQPGAMPQRGQALLQIRQVFCESFAAVGGHVGLHGGLAECLGVDHARALCRWRVGALHWCDKRVNLP